jgi:mannose-1-phosphate guanylyltransferase
MDALAGYAKDGRMVEGMDATYPDLGKISIDYALMEKAQNIVMACGTFCWDDVGAWPALENHFEQDAFGNTKIGQVEVLDAEGNIVLSKDRLTAVIGVKDLVVVQAEGVTLVCPKDRAQDIKKMIVALRENGTYDRFL